MAKEPLIVQRVGKSLVGYTEKDQDLLESVAEFKSFEISTKGVKNKEGAAHLRLYWASCAFTADELGDPDLNSKYKVDTYLRHTLKFYDLERCITKFECGVAVLVVMVLMSISLKNMDYIIKKNYFNESIKTMADLFMVDDKVFVDEVKKKMLRRNR